MGGGLAAVSTHDWKYAAIQQIGLKISEKFSSVEESFLAASEKSDKIDFMKFERFVQNTEALRGFNITQ